MLALDVRIFQWMHATFSQGGWLALMCVLTVIGSGWGALFATHPPMEERIARLREEP